MNSEFGTRWIAAISVALGVCAIIVPQWFGTTAVMVLAAVMVASGIIALLHLYAVSRQRVPLGILGPWAQIVAGLVVLIWPGLALWLVAVLFGGGLVLAGIMGLYAFGSSPDVNPPVRQKIGCWAVVVLGGLLIVTGATGSALLLGVVLGITLIANGVQQWRTARV